MILIDNVLDSLIDEFSALPFKKLDGAFNHMTLVQKAHLACALGAISQGELACIKEINRRRNDLAHRLDLTVTQKDEEHIVNVFAGQTKLFSGLTYYPQFFPRTLIFVLILLFQFLHIRMGKEGQQIKHVPDDTNTEAIGAIALTQTVVEVVNNNLDSDDAKIMDIIKTHIDEAKRFRDEYAKDKETN